MSYLIQFIPNVPRGTFLNLSCWRIVHNLPIVPRGTISSQTEHSPGLFHVEHLIENGCRNMSDTRIESL